MLHLNIVKDPYSYSHNVWLNSVTQIESDFVSVLNFNENAFRDKPSLRFLKEMDHSHRVGDYGIVTQFGKSCITCLATGFKMALLIMHYTNYGRKDLRIFANVTNDPLWKWLNENTDVTVCMTTEQTDTFYLEFGLMKIGDFDINYIGITKEDFDKYCDEKDKLTDEKVKKSFEKYHLDMQKNDTVRITKFGRIPALDFISQFPNSENQIDFLNKSYWEYEPESEQKYEIFCGYSVINNSVGEIRNSYIERAPAILLVKKKDGKYSFQDFFAVKYPTLPEIWDCIFSDFADDDFDELLFVFTCGNIEKVCDDYAANTEWGAVVNRADRTVTLLSKNDAVERFYNLYMLCETLPEN